MDRIFEALASTARRQILAYLSAGELSAGGLVCFTKIGAAGAAAVANMKASVQASAKVVAALEI